MKTSTRHETVVVGVDGTAASSAAVRWAAAEAERRHARLHAVHVVEHAQPEATSPDHDIRLDLDAARQTVPGRVGGWVFRAGIEVDIAVSVVTGDVARQLAREAGDASLVVIGTPDSLHHSALPADLACGCLCPVAMVGALGDVTYVDAFTHSSTKGASHARA
jgi:nucleotide-binding universal stress UspA family protein